MELKITGIKETQKGLHSLQSYLDSVVKMNDKQEIISKLNQEEK